jgi:pseudouridine 5'-phosphatase
LKIVNCKLQIARPAFRAVVFDMDGLIFNTEDIYTRVGSELLRRRGRQFSLELKHAMMGLPPKQSFQMMIRRLQLDDTWEDLSRESNDLFVNMLPGRIKMLPGVTELLDRLEAMRLPKAIATSSCRELTDACLLPFDLARRFQLILTSEDITDGKPHPEIYLTAAKRLGVRPTEMLVLEDSENGCRAAAAAKAFTVAVPGGHSRGQDFSMASLIIDGLADSRLVELLASYAKA